MILSFSFILMIERVLTNTHDHEPEKKELKYIEPSVTDQTNLHVNLTETSPEQP